MSIDNFAQRQPEQLEYVDHRQQELAAEILAIQLLAYAQEAKLIGAIDFPPLNRTVTDIQGSAERFLVARRDGKIVGALSFESDDEGADLLIGSLVVHPSAQRQGTGRRLVAEFLRLHGNVRVAVSTGAANGPALALYAQFGFVETARRFLGPERLEVVRLLREASADK